MKKTKFLILLCLIGDFLLATVSWGEVKPSGETKTSASSEVQVKKLPVQRAGKRININGTVFDSQKSPLIGVTVTVKGTKEGTITDINGNFFLDVASQNSILQFKYLGYKDAEVKVGGQLNINVMMEEISNSLNEVEVVGYGSQKRASVVGAITTIEPSKLQVGTERALSNNLAGSLAGVIGVQRSGEVGYDGSSFWIRGLSSFGAGTSPLVLVDGVERTLDDYDPAEIQSISVLKDAAASAVYGVRGANGVVLITTRRGKVGKPTINVRLEQGITQPTSLPHFLGAADYMTVLNGISKDDGTTPLFTQQRIDATRNHVDPDLYPDVNWINAIMKDQGSNTRTNVTLNGGNTFLRYSIVQSVYFENGLIARDKTQSYNSSDRLERYNVSSDVDLNLTPTTLVQVNLGGFLENQYKSKVGYDNVFTDAFLTVPFIHPTIYSSGQIPMVFQRANPWAESTQTGYMRQTASKIESEFVLDQDLKFLTPGLKTKLIYSFDRWSQSTVDRTTTPDYYTPATSRNPDGSLNLSILSYGQPYLGYSPWSTWGNKNQYFEWNTTYTKQIGKSTLDLLYLYNMREYDDGSIVPYRNQGMAGRVSLNYDNRYVGEFDFGYNGSENFAPSHRFGFFPSVALGWLLSEEPYMKKYKKIFSTIKFRGSMGKVGNQTLSGRRFAYITTINSIGGYTWGSRADYGRGGYQEGEIGVPNLTWETVDKKDLGLELGLFNTIELQADLFNELRSNIFLQRQTIPASSGFPSTPWANFGKVRNQGVDLSLDVNKQINKNLGVSIRGTFTYAANKILEMDEPAGLIGTNRAHTGHHVNQFFGLIAERLYTAADFNADGTLKSGIPTPTFMSSVRPGDIMYKDVNKDGLVNSLDQTAIGGTYDPEIVYGFGGTVKYKNFDFGCFFQGNGLTWRMLGGSFFLPGSNSGVQGNIFTNVGSRWTVSNPSQNVFWPRLTLGDNPNNSQPSTWWLKNMSMLRCKNLEIGYTFPMKWISKIGAKSIRLFFTGNNMFVLSGFKLWDPELGTNNGCRYPILKSESAGLDFNF